MKSTFTSIAQVDEYFAVYLKILLLLSKKKKKLEQIILQTFCYAYKDKKSV